MMTELRTKFLKILHDKMEFVILFILLAATFIFASYFNLHELIYVYYVKYEWWYSDEMIVVAAVWFFILFAFMIYYVVKFRRSFEKLVKKNKYESIISSVVKSINSTIELQDILDNAANSVFENMDNAVQVTIFMVEDKYAVLKASIGLPDWFAEIIAKIPYPKGITWKVISDCKLTYCSDVEKNEFMGPEGREMGIQSCLSVPFMYKGEAVGCIAIHSFKKSAFSDDEIHLLEIITSQIETAVSNAKQASALSDSENRHRSIIENTYDMIIETDSTGNILYTNPQVCETLGYTYEEVLGRNCREFVHQEDIVKVLASFNEELNLLETPQTVVCRGIHKNGGLMWLEATGRAFSKSSGEVRTVISCKDITERLEAEEKQHEADERFRTLVENSYDMIVDVSIDGKFLFANQNHEVFLGYKPEELIGKSIFEYIHPEDKSDVISSFMKTSQSGTSNAEIVFRYMHKDGSWRWLNSIGKSYKTAGGEVRGVITSHDITDQKLGEEKKREIEERYRTLVEYSHDLIVELNDKGEFTFANQNHKNQLGYDPEELIGRNVLENIHSDDKSSILKTLLAGLNTLSCAGAHQFRYKHKNGEYKWLESIGTPFKTPSGEIRAVIYSKDVTEQRKMEEEILKSQKIESLSILAGGIAHDFNNLLTIVLGNVNLARINTAPEDFIYTRLREAENAIQRATGLTRQLLAFSKGSSLDAHDMTIKELLRVSTEFALRGSSVECNFLIDDALSPVEVDEGQINQVINNLIINAKHAMPDGGKLEVGASNETLQDIKTLSIPQGQYVKIYIKDHGCGIPASQLQKIFDPFFTTKKSGSGLGLASSYSIIKQHKGDIIVESEENVGTTFTIYLPIYEQSVPEATEKEDGIMMGKGTVLIMDDDESIRDLLGEMIVQLGYTPAFAENSSQAIMLYTDNLKNGGRFDAVILDLTIPGDIGGKETFKKLVELDPEIRAIVSSGYSEDGTMSHYREVGFKASLSKPYIINEVSEVLYSVTKKDNADAEKDSDEVQPYSH